MDAVVEACAKAAAENVESLARTAVEETGFGNVPDKIIKNTLAAVNVPRAIRGMRTVGILREDREKGIVEVASPVGVVAAVIPCTNPTSTAIYKTLISIKARNAIVLSPHPSAIKCICQTATLLESRRARRGRARGPDQLHAAHHARRHARIDAPARRRRDSGDRRHGPGARRLQLRQAGIRRGAGQRARVHRTHRRCAQSRRRHHRGHRHSTTARFVPPSRPSSRKNPCANALSRNAALQGAYFLSPEEMEKVGRLVILPGTHTPNTKIVGRPATMIAEMAGIKVPPATRVLIARLEPSQVGREFPLSAEKLSPILAFYAVANLAEGIALCRRLLRIWRAGAYLLDSFAESRGDPRIWGSHARVSRGREQLFGARLDRLLDQSVSGDDAGLRRSRRQHHFGQYRPAASDERKTDCLGIARRRAQDDSCGSAHGRCGDCCRSGGRARKGKYASGTSRTDTLVCPSRRPGAAGTATNDCRCGSPWCATAGGTGKSACPTRPRDDCARRRACAVRARNRARQRRVQDCVPSAGIAESLGRSRRNCWPPVRCFRETEGGRSCRSSHQPRQSRRCRVPARRTKPSLR